MQGSTAEFEDIKKRVDGGESLDAMLEQSIVVGAQDASAAKADSESQSFNFDIKIFKISGTIWKSGKLEYSGSIFGVEIGKNTADLSKGEFCQNPKVGKIAEVKYCFSFSNNCLHTRGDVGGWFVGKKSWNKKILCF